MAVRGSSVVGRLPHYRCKNLGRVGCRGAPLPRVVDPMPCSEPEEHSGANGWGLEVLLAMTYCGIIPHEILSSP